MDLLCRARQSCADAPVWYFGDKKSFIGKVFQMKMLVTLHSCAVSVPVCVRKYKWFSFLEYGTHAASTSSIKEALLSARYGCVFLIESLYRVKGKGILLWIMIYGKDWEYLIKDLVNHKMCWVGNICFDKFKIFAFTSPHKTIGKGKNYCDFWNFLNKREKIFEKGMKRRF